MLVYIVAQERETPFFFFPNNPGPNLLGIMQTRESAEAACTTPQHFYIEWQLGAVLSSGDALSDVERRVYPRRT